MIDGVRAEFLYQLYEGEVKGGFPNGFGRMIYGLRDMSFIGYFADKTYT